MSDSKKPFIPTRYSASVLPRTGQRVRFAVSQKHAAADWKGVIVKGTLCDVVDLLHVAEEGVHPVLVVDAYIREGETVQTVRVEVLPEALESVKGKPFVVGVDDRRADRSSDALAGRKSANDDVDALLAGLRDRLTKGSGVERDEVERIVAEVIDSDVTPIVNGLESRIIEAERQHSIDHDSLVVAEDRITAVEGAVTAA